MMKIDDIVTRNLSDILFAFSDRKYGDVEGLISGDNTDGDITDARFWNQFAADLRSGKLAIFNTQPQCMSVIEGDQCESAGRFQPFLLVYVKGQQNPVAQLEMQPPLRLCIDHRSEDVEHFVTREQWKNISAQVVRQLGIVPLLTDAQVAYFDHETQQMQKVEPRIIT